MAQDPDEERIRRKAHELWEAEGHPHGRDQDHWDQARELVAIEDSQASTLLPRNTGAEEPVEWRQAAENYGDFPNLTDQGNDGLTDIGREPVLGGTGSTSPTAKPAAARSRKPAEKAALQPDETRPAAKRNGSAGPAAASIVAASQKKSGRKGSGKTI